MIKFLKKYKYVSLVAAALVVAVSGLAAYGFKSNTTFVLKGYPDVFDCTPPEIEWVGMVGSIHPPECNR